ncbi:MAG TPA: hypothetical protein VGB64_04365 [Actinomycetota bacterium]
MIAMVTLASLALPARGAYAAAAAAAAAASVAVTPTIETMASGGSYSPSATVRDGAGAAVSGVVVDWRVIDGGHAIDDLDGNEFTPAGVIGVCTTNASGFCTVSYTGVRTTLDTVRALVDADHDSVADDGEPLATATIDWRSAGNGPSRLRLDMSGCDGDAAAPIDEATWSSSAVAIEVAGVRAVCAARFDAADGSAPGPVAFTIIGGPGVFTDATGAQDLGTAVAVQVAGEINQTFLRSTVAGTTTVRASFASTVADGTAAWSAGAARTIALAGPVNPASGSASVVTATVLDRFANPAPGVGIAFSAGGAGGFSGGVESVTATTGPAGTATAGVQTAAGEIGTQTIAASLSPHETDCGRVAGDPTGASAGICRADVALNWIEAAPTLSLLVSPEIGVWGTQFAISGTLAAGGSGIPGKSVLISARPVGTGPDAWQPVAVPVTDELGLFIATAAPSLHTEYKAVFAGDASFTPAVSGSDRADVRVGLHLNASSPSLRSGQTVVFTGRILPEHPGHPVYLQQLTPGGWRTIATTRGSGTSWYRFRVVKRSPGGLLFRTVTPSDFHHAWNASVNRRVDWH